MTSIWLRNCNFVTKATYLHQHDISYARLRRGALENLMHSLRYVKISVICNIFHNNCSGATQNCPASLNTQHGISAGKVNGKNPYSYKEGCGTAYKEETTALQGTLFLFKIVNLMIVIKSS